MQEIRFTTPLGEWSAATTPPPPDLRAMVAEFWEVRGAVGYGYEKLIPSGFGEFIVNLGPPHCVLEPESLAPQATYRRAWLSGLHDRPLFTAPCHGVGSFYTHLTAARLTPTGIYALFGTAGSELSNRVIEASDVLGAGVHHMRERLADSMTTSCRFAVLAAFLRESAKRHAHRAVPLRAVRALDKTISASGNLRVADLCKELGISRKHLNAQYQRLVGLSPKTYARLVRFRSVMARIDDPGGLEWARTAADLGYFDQAHLVRDFSAFAGESPRTFLARRAPDHESVVYADEPARGR